MISVQRPTNESKRIVVIGGTGLIGSKTVAILHQGGAEVVAASRKCGVNTFTGEGLKEAIAGGHVVIDLSHAPSLDAKAALEFFDVSGKNLLAAEAAVGVQHHVALSIVGVDRVPEQAYYRAKVAQEKLIEASSIPYTIIRSTQFLEFLGGIADASTDGSVVRLPPGLLQPIAADDVAVLVTEVALARPRNGIIEIAGPERAPLNEIVARYLKAVGDPRRVVKDPEARYFGGRLEEESLVPLGEARLGHLTLEEWLRHSRKEAPEQAVAARVDQGWKEDRKNEDQPLCRGRKPMKIRTIIAAMAFSMAGTVFAHESESETVMKNFEAAIPNIPGKSLIALEVDYAPGAVSPSHIHAKSAFIYAYVISGAIESKVDDGETRIYRAGESWSEAPGATHSISRNTSKTEPAKLLAIFVLDTNDNPLTTPIK
jgi:uncharacterized protein YbjT (DUF2867 family)/quercetin dioxygenase-like cupin family protein